jgi:hypothetical protein
MDTIIKNIIIIPYRDRETHLKYFLENVSIFLLKNVEKSSIIIIEQSRDKEFNRGKLLNIGFKEYLDTASYFITHDIDKIPNNNVIKHYNTEKDIYCLWKPHEQSLGGVTKFSKDSIKSLNGFPNYIYGWGIEDRALFHRAKIKNIPINYLNNNKEFKELSHKSCADGYIGEKKKISDIWTKRFIDSIDNIKKQELIDNSGIMNLKYKILKDEIIKEGVRKILVAI